MTQPIRVRGARQHNLKGIDVEIPRGQLTVITGPSGSGKSSLAFDTVYAEGQRRYVESLSTYAKQFLERMPKPDVDWVEGVSPAVAIDQRNAIQSSRSTVGTVTEVYDYMRLLWARVGETLCPNDHGPIRPDTVASVADRVEDWEPGTRFYVTFPFRFSDEITGPLAVMNLQSQGYLRVLFGREELYLPDLLVGPDGESGDAPAGTAGGAAATDAQAAELELRGPDITGPGELLVIVDRASVAPDQRERLTDSIATAYAEGRGSAVVVRVRPEDHQLEPHLFTERFQCAVCEFELPEPRPAGFSFNSPAGACPECTGFGAVLEYADSLIVPNPERSLEDGALDPWTKPRYERERAAVLEWARENGVDTGAAWHTLSESDRQVLMHGGRGFRGVVPFLRSRESKRYKAYIRVFLRSYQLPRTCPVCNGTRLQPEALAVRVGRRTIAEAAAMRIDQLATWVEDLSLPEFSEKVAATILDELTDRLAFLERVGLGYLTLDRQARSLSGGEMQRIRLAGCLGSRLVDSLYVLDEPTIGLHPHDIERFVDVLEALAARDNTVLVVEHELELMRRADHLIELGPGAGEKGGEIAFEGGWAALKAADTTTGRAIARRGEPQAASGGIRRRKSAAPGEKGWLRLEGATLHNLSDVDVELPRAALTVVTGVSGSGKSTLIRHVLHHAIERELAGESTAKLHLGEPEGTYRALRGLDTIRRVVLVDQSPIGRTPRSNPATYIGAWGEIRKLFAAQPESVRRGYAPGFFSFNKPGGRCEACKGAGEEIVEMVFLADVSVPCEECGGARFGPEVLEVEYRGRTIEDVLDLTVDEAIRFFIKQDRLGEALWQLQRVGLGYLRLGQPATTLSGGEAQRLKIARELARPRKSGATFYILDEPTVGLGVSEVETLNRVLRQLVREGHTVVVIEHNLDVIADADWVVDLGPGAADDGGTVVAAGPPQEVAATPGSRTGTYLRDLFSGRTAATESERDSPAA